MKCWYCSDDHKLGSWDQFLSKPSFERKKFFDKEKLCWNSLAKGDTGSDTTLLKSDVAKKIGLSSDYKNLRITNAVSKTSELELKQVSFKESSESHPNFVDMENAWVDSELDIKCQPINIFKLKKEFDDLTD